MGGIEKCTVFLSFSDETKHSLVSYFKYVRFNSFLFGTYDLFSVVYLTILTSSKRIFILVCSSGGVHKRTAYGFYAETHARSQLVI